VLPSDDLHFGDPDIGHLHLLAGFGPGGQFIRGVDGAGEVPQVDVPENGGGSRFVASLGVQRRVEYGGQVISGSISPVLIQASKPSPIGGIYGSPDLGKRRWVLGHSPRVLG
jgi:hypothetical protein